MRISIAVLAALLAGCSGNDGTFSSAPPSLHVGEVALNAGQPQFAIGVADTQLSLNSRNAEALLLRARGYALQGRLFEAETDYRRALLDKSTANEAAIGLSRILTATNPTAAASLLAEITIKGNANAGVWNNLGVARDLQDRHAEAQTAYRKALEADPAMTSARANLSRSLAMTPETQTFAMAPEPAPLPPVREARSVAAASEPTPAASAPETRPMVVAADTRPVLPAPETRSVAVADDAPPAPATQPTSAPQARPLAVATAAPVPAPETHPVAVAREAAKPQVLPAIALATVAAPAVSATASCSKSGAAPLPVVNASFVDSLLHPYRQAMEAAEADVRCDPSNLEFRRRLMDVALQSGDDEKAGALAKMTVQQAPNDPRGYVMTAAVERFRGNYREGLESLLKAKTLLNTVADLGNAKTRLD